MGTPYILVWAVRDPASQNRVACESYLSVYLSIYLSIYLPIYLLWQVCVRPDTKLLATGGWDRRVRVWQWGKWKPLAVLRYHTGTVNAVCFSPCSRWLASASNDRTVAIWSIYPPLS